eukprot:jgi/Chlat1/2671/Chrsp18S02989
MVAATRRIRMAWVAAACGLVLFLGVARCDDGLSEHVLESVPVSAETEPVASSGDSADDPAIWYNAADPAQSLIIATDKNKDTGGLYLYDLNGTVLSFTPGGVPNNVDVRGDVVAATSRADNGIMVWHIRAEDRSLHSLGSISNLFDGDEEIYGFCLYKSPVSGKLYAFVTTKSGKVVQYELIVDETYYDDHPVLHNEVHRFEVGSIAEGLVADDEHAKLYVSEENVALWQYSAEPDSDGKRKAVDYVPEDDGYDSGHLAADIEGLTIYYAANGMGYLIASSQGDSTYAVYNRTGNNEYLGSFRLVKNPDAGVDGTQDTDGIDVISKSLGPAYPYGLDGHNNDNKNQNFKLVAWENIANALDLVINAASTNATEPDMAPAPAPAPPPEGSAEVPVPAPAPAPSPEPAAAPPPDESGSAAPPPDASTPPPPSPDAVPPPPSPAPSPPPQEQVPAAPPPVTGSEGSGDKTGVPPSGNIPEPKSSSSAGRWTFVFLVVVVLAVAGYFAHKRGYLARLPFWPFNSVQQRPRESYLQLRSFDRV